MNNKNDNADNDEAEERSEFTTTELPEDAHMEYRRCKACGNNEMAPKASFAADGLTGTTEHGLQYKCPECGAEVKISDSGAIFMGAVYSLFWGAVGLWAFYEGPLWYLGNLSYFKTDDIVFMVMDIGVVLFTSAVAAFSVWIIWTFLLKPVKIMLQHPVTSQNRERTQEENAGVTGNRRSALLSLFVYPLFIWVPVLALFWVVDAVGINIRDNEFIAYGTFGLVIAAAYPVGKRLGANPYYTFIGMALWMGAFVALIFAL